MNLYEIDQANHYRIISNDRHGAMEFFQGHMADCKAVSILAKFLRKSVTHYKNKLLRNLLFSMLKTEPIIMKERKDYNTLYLSEINELYNNIHHGMMNIRDHEFRYNFMVKNESWYHASLAFHELPLKRRIALYPTYPKGKEICTGCNERTCIFLEYMELLEENKALRALPGGAEYREALARFDEMRTPAKFDFISFLSSYNHGYFIQYMYFYSW